MAITGAILAGGRSSRMGTNKAFLTYHGERLIERAIRRFSEQFSDVVIVANDVERYRGLGPRVVPDLIPGFGPLGGLHAALWAAQTPYVFLAACDMPFAEPAMAFVLRELGAGADVVVPRFDGIFETMHALYARAALPAIEADLRAGRGKMIGFYPRVKVRAVDEAELAPRFPDLARIFWNLNTPADYERLLQGLGPAPERPDQ